jgi:hypothetical protein
MVTDEEAVTPRISSQSCDSEGSDSDAMPLEGIAEGLNVLKRDSFQPTVSETPQPEVSKPMFVLPHWHKAYAEALLSTDSLVSPGLISWAEMEIQTRYQTDFACPIEPDERLDLRRATEVLSRLKNVTIVVSRAKWALALWASLV